MYVELSGSVICASASSLKPFFVRFLPSLLSSHFNGYSDNGRSRDRTGAIELSSSRRTGTTRSKTQKDLAHNPTRAFELESGNESESGRKIDTSDGDEKELWSGSPADRYRPDEPLEGATFVTVSSKQAQERKTKATMKAHHPDWRSPTHIQDHSPIRTSNGINVVRETEISYATPRAK
jgi:hypothetical protein